MSKKTCADDFTRFIWVAFLATKDGPRNPLENFVEEFEMKGLQGFKR